MSMSSAESPRGRSEQREDEPSSRLRKARSISRRVAVSLLAVAGSGSFSSTSGTRSTVVVEARTVAKMKEEDHEVYGASSAEVEAEPGHQRAETGAEAGQDISGGEVEVVEQEENLPEFLLAQEVDVDGEFFSDVEEDEAALLQEGEELEQTTENKGGLYRCRVSKLQSRTECEYQSTLSRFNWKPAHDDCCEMYFKMNGKLVCTSHKFRPQFLSCPKGPEDDKQQMQTAPQGLWFAARADTYDQPTGTWLY